MHENIDEACSEPESSSLKVPSFEPGLKSEYNFAHKFFLFFSAHST